MEAHKVIKDFDRVNKLKLLPMAGESSIIIGHGFRTVSARRINILCSVVFWNNLLIEHWKQI